MIQTHPQMAHFHSWHKQTQKSVQVKLQMWAKQTSLCFYTSFWISKQEHHLKSDQEQLQELKQSLMRKKIQTVRKHTSILSNLYQKLYYFKTIIFICVCVSHSVDFYIILINLYHFNPIENGTFYFPHTKNWKTSKTCTTLVLTYEAFMWFRNMHKWVNSHIKTRS